jgi:hypothetical protein
MSMEACGSWHCKSFAIKILSSPDWNEFATGMILSVEEDGAPGRTRTCNRQLRRLMLYPVELRAPNISQGKTARR